MKLPWKHHKEKVDGRDQRIRNLEEYLEGYRSLLTTQLDVDRFEQAVEELRRRKNPRVRASRRNELAYAYLYFSRLVRGEVEASAEIPGIDRIFFLPLDPDERSAFVSYRRLEEVALARHEGDLVFEFFPLISEEVGWRTLPTQGVVDARRLEIDEADSLFPGLLGVLESRGGRPGGSLLTVRQTVRDTPSCLIVMTAVPVEETTGSFSEDDQKDLAALTRMFFQTYRSVRLANFTKAYRGLVDENLILPKQWNAIESTADRIEVPKGISPRPFAQFLCFFCDCLSRSDVLPEMDNAFFFPLSSPMYYLYHNVMPAERPQRRPGLLAGNLRIDGERSREDLLRIHDRLAGMKLPELQGTPEQRCRDIFSDALGLLCATASAETASRELRDSLGRVGERISEYLKALGQDAEEGKSPLVTVVEAALFGTVRWEDWGLELMDQRFLTYRGDDERDIFGSTGSLLALTILVDHLPLGILFINSALAGAFGEEDQGDVQAISRGYLQTFQTRMLAYVVDEYQGLEERLSVSALAKERLRSAAHRGEPVDKEKKKDIRESFELYFERMFSGFEDLEVGAFFAVDRDELLAFRRGEEGKSSKLSKELLKKVLDAEQKRALEDELSSEIGTAVVWGDPASRIKRFYRWALLRAIDPNHKVLTDYPLHQIPVRLFQEGENAETEGEPKLRAVLKPACLEASVLDEDFPLLRQLLLRITGAQIFPSNTGSVIALALFYDALPAGLILLGSSSFLAFTSRIEMLDAFMATRAFLLPLQMEAREEVIHAYQNILGEGGEQHRDFFGLAQGFLNAMAESLPTMQAGFFFSLDRDLLVSVAFNADGDLVPYRWTGRALQDFGRASEFLEDELETRIRNIDDDSRQLENRAEKGDWAARTELRDADVRHLYLRGILDLFQGSRNPKQYDLENLVRRIFGRNTPAKRDPQDQEISAGLRSHIHVFAKPKCRFREEFPYLHRLFVLQENDAYRANEHEEHWKGGGALLAVVVLQEGLPLGIAFLASPIEGSFTEHERIDVDRSARAFFSEGQVHLRDEIILAYRNIVRGMLSEAGAQEHIEKLSARNDELRGVLEGDELAGFLGVFMDVMFEAFRTDPPSAILFLPFTERTLYAGLPAEESSLGRLQKANIAALDLALPAESTWDGFIQDWLQDLYRDIRAQKPELPREPPHSPAEVLAALRLDTDTALATFLFSGQRYDDLLQDRHRHAYLAPFRKALAGNAAEREAGSLLVTALLYDQLPAAGLLVINSPIPWRFTEQDRLDVESVSRAFFLTYRSIRLRREASRAARLKGMQDMLLGVTHRLKNDLTPTLRVIDVLQKMKNEGDASIVAGRVKELEERGLLEAGRLGIDQVQKRFDLLRSVVSGSAHLRKARSLQDIAVDFHSHVQDYKKRLPLRYDRYETASDVRLSINEFAPHLLTPLTLSPSQIITKLDEIWADVSDGLDEVLAIYAENGVKAVAESAGQTDSIYLWFLVNQERPNKIDLVLFDSVLIPPSKIPYIEKREVIPMEVGGGSGTGLYNAGNLLALNNDGDQVIRSNEAIGGTAIQLTLDRLLVLPLEASSDAISADIERWRARLMEVFGADFMEWGSPNRIEPALRVMLYEGSYCWSEELFPVLWQIFSQRRNLLKNRRELSTSYRVNVDIRIEDREVVVEFSDNSSLEFVAVARPHKQRDQFERNHNELSKVGPTGAVGSLFLAMQERLYRHSRIVLAFSNVPAITVRIPVANSEPKLNRLEVSIGDRG